MALLDAARTALGARRVELTLVDDQRSRWSSQERDDGSPDAPLAPFGGVLWATALRGRRPQLLHVLPAGEGPPLRANEVLLVTPLLLQGSVTGVLAALIGRSPLDSDEDHIHLVRTVAQLIALSLGSATLTARLRAEVDDRAHDAMHDTLTGLANRVAFEQAVDDELTLVEQSLASSEHRAGALLIIDINRFKEINASLGHHVGDAVVVEVARRIVESLPKGATAARFGGDQFAVLLPDIGGTEPAMTVGDALLEAVCGIVELETVDVPVGAAIGVAVAPLHGGTRHFLLRRADVAMHAAKEQRKPAIEMYAPEHEQVSTRQLSLAADLRRALDGDELEVHYQPKSTIVTNQVVGVKRWYGGITASSATSPRMS